MQSDTLSHDDAGLMQCMIEVARNAGDIALSYRKRPQSVQIQSKDDQSVVTLADQEIETLYQNRLWLPYGGAFLGEENGKQAAAFNPKWEWRVDPIDGTVNYAGGIIPGGYPSKSETCTSVALWDVANNEPLKAVVYNFVTGDVYGAEKGKGAYVIDRHGTQFKLKMPDICHPAVPPQIHIAGFDVRYRGLIYDTFTKLVGECHDTRASSRTFGSSAMEIVHVATSSASAYVGELKKWDYSAAFLIAQEAGAHCQLHEATVESDKDTLIVSNNPELTKELGKTMQKMQTLRNRGIFPQSIDPRSITTDSPVIHTGF